MAQDQKADPTSQRTQTIPDRADEGGRSLVSGFERLRGTISQLVGRVKRLQGPIAALAAVGAILGGFVGYWNTYRAVTDTVGPRAVRPASVPPAVSLALMPFVPATGDPEEQRFASALSENLLALMGKSKLLRIASARKVQEYKGKANDLRALDARSTCAI